MTLSDALDDLTLPTGRLSARRTSEGPSTRRPRPWAYPAAPCASPLCVRGGAAFEPNQIDHFEVMAFDGRKLVQVDAWTRSKHTRGAAPGTHVDSVGAHA